MTETTEETIARLAKERAKTILENSDYWSGPGPAKTSAEAVGTLLSYRWQLETPKPEEIPEPIAAVIKEARAIKAKKQESAFTETNGEPESADV